jgi:hypothetical protein
MTWLFTVRSIIYPRERYIWVGVRILHETDRAVLVYNGMKVWIPKALIYGMRLRNNVFEFYIKEGAIG